ncbi:MAG TPA: hypothetical protein VGM85_16200 [Paraburkholderia sp.]
MEREYRLELDAKDLSNAISSLLYQQRQHDNLRIAFQDGSLTLAMRPMGHRHTTAPETMAAIGWWPLAVDVLPVS